MIVHVAAAGEDRGRVVLQLVSGNPSAVAIEAAMRVAQAFGSEVESLFVEDQQLFELAQFPLARQVSLCGRRIEMISPDLLAQQMRHAAQSVLRRVGAVARAADVPLKSSVVRDEPVNAVARACARCGPWNIVALADTLTGARGGLIRQLFAAVSDTTGVLVTGPLARRTSGPVVVALEDIAHLEPMLRVAARLTEANDGQEIQLVVIGVTEAEALEKEGQVRLALAAAAGADGRTDPASPAAAPMILRAGARHGSPVEIVEVLRRLHGSFVLAHFGGFLAPGNSDLRHLTGGLECPLFLLR